MDTSSIRVLIAAWLDASWCGPCWCACTKEKTNTSYYDCRKKNITCRGSRNKVHRRCDLSTLIARFTQQKHANTFRFCYVLVMLSLISNYMLFIYKSIAYKKYTCPKISLKWVNTYSHVYSHTPTRCGAILYHVTLSIQTTCTISNSRTHILGKIGHDT